jgi:hypothetical protein
VDSWFVDEVGLLLVYAVSRQMRLCLISLFQLASLDSYSEPPTGWVRLSPHMLVLLVLCCYSAANSAGWSVGDAALQMIYHACLV